MRFKKRFLIYGLVILILYLTVLPPVHIGATETAPDFTTYTEYDPQSRCAVSATTIDVDGLDAQNELFVYKDFGAGYFQESWEVNFSMDLTGTDVGATNHVMMFSNTIDYAEGGYDTYDTATADRVILEVRTAGGNLRWNIQQLVSGIVVNNMETGHVSTSYLTGRLYYTWSYVKETGTYGTLYVSVYTDEERLTLLASANMALTNERNDWRYFAPVVGWDAPSGTVDFYMDIQDVTLEDNMDAAAVDWVSNEFDSYNPVADQYWYLLTGNITDGGGVDQYVEVFWKEDGDPSYQSHYLQSTYETGEQFHWLIEVEDAVTYWWYAEIWSPEYGTFGFSPVSFTANVTEHIAPMMWISSFSTSNEFYADGDSSWALINGGVWYDGGDNVTGYIQYSENTTDWTDSSGTANLTTDDEFSANITGLSENTLYYFRAKGVNVNGTGYSPISTFEIGDWTDPVVSLSHSNVTGDTADITANLTFDGNDDECYVNIHYRISGTSTWSGDDWGGVYLSENETTTWTLTGLTPSTTYDYRAVAWNQCYLNADCDFYFTDTFQFTTTGVSGTPSANLTIVGYQDDYTAYGTAEVLNDSGRPCKISLEYKAVGSSYTYWSRNIYIHPEQYCDGLEEGDTCTTFVTDLVLGNTYHFRARIENDLGFFSYSNIVTYKLERGTSSTTPGGGDDDLEIASGLRAWLAQFGLDNESGRALFVFIVMIACWLIVFIPGRRWMELIAVTAPVAGILDAVVLIIAMVINFVPVWATVVVVVVFAGMIAGLAVKVFGMRRGSA